MDYIEQLAVMGENEKLQDHVAVVIGLLTKSLKLLWFMFLLALFIIHTGSIRNISTIVVHNLPPPFGQGVDALPVESRGLGLEEVLEVSFECLVVVKVLPLQVVLKGAKKVVV